MNPFERIQGIFGAMGGISPQQQQMGMLAPMNMPPKPMPKPQAPQTMQMSLGQKINNHLQDNRSAMMALASGMMGGPGQPGSLGQGFQNYAVASPLDTQRQEKEQRKNATHDWLKKQGYGDEDIEFFKANPSMMAEALKPKTASEASQKIDRLVSTGMDRDTAIGIADGSRRISINPMTGERVMIDMGNQEIMPLQQPQSATAQPANPGQQTEGQGGSTLWDMAPQATGMGASISRGLTDTLGQIPGAGEMFQSPETVQAQQNFDLFKRDLVRSLSLNPRFPISEQKRIEGLLPTGAFTAPETLQTTLIELDKEFQRIESEVSAGANDPNAPIQQRQQDAATLRSIGAARQRLGVPGGANTPGSGADLDGLKNKYGLE